MAKSNQKRRAPNKKGKRQSAKKKASHSFLNEIGSVAKGVYNVAKAAAPFVAMLPFETSNHYAMATGSGAAINSIAAPVANATATRTLKARMSRSKSGSVHVAHREYIGDIVLFPNDLFNIQIAQNINPGNASLFPWLSTIANNFEKFVFQNLRFIYEPQSSTTTPGTVMMAVDWDSRDTNPVSKVEMMSYEDATRSPTWFASTYNSQPHNLHTQKQYFVTDGGSSPSGTDIHFYSVGKFILATMSDQATASSIGELYVEYDVDLITPQLEFSAPSAAITGIVGTTYGSTTPLGSAISFTKYGALGITLKASALNNSAVTGQAITFATPGAYAVSWRYSGGTLAGSNRFLSLDNLQGEGTEDLVVIQSFSSTASPNVGAGFLMNPADGFGGVFNLTVKSPGASLWVGGNTNFTPTASTVAYFLFASVTPDVFGGTSTTIVPTLSLETGINRIHGLKFIKQVHQVKRSNGLCLAHAADLPSLKQLSLKDGDSEVGSVRDHEPAPGDRWILEYFGRKYHTYAKFCLDEGSTLISPLKWISASDMSALDKQRLIHLYYNKEELTSILKVLLDRSEGSNIWLVRARCYLQDPDFPSDESHNDRVPPPKECA